MCEKASNPCKKSNVAFLMCCCFLWSVWSSFGVWASVYLAVSPSVPGKNGRGGMLCVLLTLHRPFCLALSCSSSACDLCSLKQIRVTSALKCPLTDNRRHPGEDYAVTHRGSLGYQKASLNSHRIAFHGTASESCLFETWIIFMNGNKNNRCVVDKLNNENYSNTLMRHVSECKSP